nr:MAG TPA: foot protein [Caudoviricetes sp.]
MKKLLIAAMLSAAFLAGCTDVKDVVISKKEDIETHSGDLKKLPDEDKKLVLGYFLRAEGNGLFGEKAEYGVTVGEAIKRQKEFIAKQGAVETAKKAAAEKVQKTYSVSYSGFENTEIPGIGEGLNLKLSFTNNSDKGIDAINSAIRLVVEGVDGSVTLNMGDEVFKKTLNPSETAEMIFTAAANDLRMAKIKQGGAKVNASFEKLEVLHSDGKVEKVLE